MISADCRDKLGFTFPRFASGQWGIGKSKQTLGLQTGEHGRLLLEQWVAARQHSSSGQSATQRLLKAHFVIPDYIIPLIGSNQ